MEQTVTGARSVLKAEEALDKVTVKNQVVCIFNNPISRSRNPSDRQLHYKILCGFCKLSGVEWWITDHTCHGGQAVCVAVEAGVGAVHV